MKLNINKMINDLVFVRRQEVIAALNIAGVPTNSNITPENLYNLVMNELNNQNEELYTTLGTVIDNTFDLSSIKEEGYSNTMGPQPYEEPKKGFLSGVDWGAAAANGIGLLTNFFGKKDEAPTPTYMPTQSSGGGTDISSILLLQQQQQAARDEQNRREDAAKRSATTMWVIGGVATLLIVGGIITAVIISKNKAAKAA